MIVMPLQYVMGMLPQVCPQGSLSWLLVLFGDHTIKWSLNLEINTGDLFKISCSLGQTFPILQIYVGTGCNPTVALMEWLD